jgi:MraZ protein
VHFLGRHTATLDQKNRVVVPARLRECVEERERDRFVLTVLPEGCLVLYTYGEWAAVADRLQQRFATPPAPGSEGERVARKRARALERILFQNAQQVTLDKQGRILLPESIRGRADLEREVTFIGVRNRIEIWNAAALDAIQSTFPDLEDVAEEVLG